MKKIVLNHKMNLIKDEVQKYIMEIKEILPKDYEFIICPSSIYLPYFEGKYDFKLGAQNMGYDEKGNYTGENSGYQLKSLNVSYVIIGHSERRIHFKEDNEMINKKLKDAIYYGLTPILCIGETLEERTLYKTSKVLLKQIKDAFKDLDITEDIIIAYEPIWAIGSNNPASIEIIEETLNLIKEIVIKFYGVNIKVIYGGSVAEDNIKLILKSRIVDGILIGSASSNIDKVKKILNKI